MRKRNASAPAADGAGTGPVADSELDCLFACLQGFSAIGLAVSGGSDSMAMMQLAERWRRAAPTRRPTLTVLTVDHRLRPGSAGDCKAVLTEARRLGLVAHLLTWQDDKPRSGIQAAARAARYRLLGEAALHHGLEAVATAHTEDDQAETVLMRLARGSGVDGLSGMAARSVQNGLVLLRPLLGVAKQRLAATLEAAGVTWREDPSNENVAFERVRLRAIKGELDAAGLTAPALGLAARRLRRARIALEAATDRTAREVVTLSPLGIATVALDGLLAAPEELGTRLIGRLVEAIGGQGKPVRLAQIEELYGWLATLGAAQRSNARLQQTLAATTVAIVRMAGIRRAHFTREPGRRKPSALLLNPGDRALWDGRFLVELAADAERPLEVRAHAGFAIDASGGVGGRAGAGTTVAVKLVPGFFDGKQLVAAPLLAEPGDSGRCSATFANQDMIFGGHGDVVERRERQK